MSHIVFALDLGTTAAYAHNAQETPVVGHEWFGQGESGKKSDRAKRPLVLARFHQWLASVLTAAAAAGAPLGTIIYERPFARGQAATRLLWGMAGIIEAVATSHQCAVLDATPAEIKQWAVGAGNASKGRMIDAAGFLGYGGNNEHEADAYCLLRFAEATLTYGVD